MVGSRTSRPHKSILHSIKLCYESADFKEGMTAFPEGYNELYGHNLEQTQNKCLKKMNNTCSIVKLLKENDGKIISTLGIH